MSKDARPEFTDRHPCYAKGCTERIPTHLLMCLKHWRRVPRSVRDAVWESPRGHPLHDSSRLAARASVAAKEGRALTAEEQAALEEYFLGSDGHPVKEIKR